MPYIGKPQSADPITVNSSNITDGTIVNADLSSSLTASISGAFTETSSSLALRLTDATGSINNISSSNSTRTTTLEAASSSLASDVVTLKGGGTLQSVATNASPTFVGATITGTLTAQEVHTEFESASILFSSGSTQFGNSSDDVHDFKGNTISGSATSTGSFGSVFVGGAGVNSFTSKVGIGTDNPADELEVHGATAAIKIRSTGTSAGNNPSINFQSTEATGLAARAEISADDDGASTKGALIFKTRISDSVTEAMRIDSSGKVGIGTNAPQTGRLHIHDGSSAATSYAQFTQDGTGAGSGDGLLVGVNAAEASIIYNAENTPLIFYTNTSERVRIDNAGLVGIGTNNPGNPLHLHSDTYPQLSIDGTDNSGNVGFVLSGSGGRGGMRWNGSNNDVELLREGGGVEVSLLDGGNVTFANWIYVNNRVMGASGDVRVGSNDGNEMLHLLENGTAKIDVGGSTKIFINSDGVTAGGGSAPQRALHVQGATGMCLSDGDRDRAAFIPLAADANSGGFNINVRSGGSSVFSTTFTSAGRVGIGFSSPETHLQVSGSIGSKLGGGGFLSIIRKDDTITDNDMLGAIRFGGEETDQQVSATIQAVCDATWQTNDLPTRLEFWTTPDGAGDQVKRMTIDKDGYLNVPGVYTGNTSAAANVVVTSGGFIYRSTSARKYKTNIQNYTVGLDKVNQMQPISYKSLTDTIVDSDDVDKTYAGLLADDIHNLGLSEFVEYAENGEVENLFYDRMVAVCINAIKELSTKNDALEKRIEELEK